MDRQQGILYWLLSTISNDWEGKAMAEMSNWRTSSYTKTNDCVEVADNGPDRVRVRDTKDRERAMLHFTPGSWACFVEFSKRQSV
ncbi:DUF397 domain-containing protein [Streptomyces noursei]|uniref:DUF397 domain-containing protein n=1 Tax=Streptomyces noursei TaxID=1971 RepID=UPI0035DFF143